MTNKEIVQRIHAKAYAEKQDDGTWVVNDGSDCEIARGKTANLAWKAAAEEMPDMIGKLIDGNTVHIKHKLTVDSDASPETKAAQLEAYAKATRAVGGTVRTPDPGMMHTRTGQRTSQLSACYVLPDIETDGLRSERKPIYTEQELAAGMHRGMMVEPDAPKPQETTTTDKVGTLNAYRKGHATKVIKGDAAFVPVIFKAKKKAAKKIKRKIVSQSRRKGRGKK